MAEEEQVAIFTSLCHQDQSSQRVLDLFGLVWLCFLSFLQNNSKKQTNVLQKGTKISQTDFCLARMGN